MTTEWIAEELVVFVHPDGRQIAGRIAVGRPAQISDVEAICPVVLEGMSRPVSVHGATTLQALLLGVRLLGVELHHHRARGWRVIYPDEDEDVGLEALFGPLLREALDDVDDDDGDDGGNDSDPSSSDRTDG